jgi:hypothetical protein
VAPVTVVAGATSSSAESAPAAPLDMDHLYTAGVRLTYPLTAIATAVAALMLAAGVSGAPNAEQQGCETPVYQNGLDVVFIRATTQASADRRTAEVTRIGFKGVKTVRESCSSWLSVLRGVDNYSAAVGVQAEARRVSYYPTIECVLAQEIGQIQAIFGTRPTMDELNDVIATANRFGYIGIKTKRAPCGGYQAYVAGFTSKTQALDFAKTASERTGLHVVVVKA